MKSYRLSHRFDQALLMAVQLHRNQVRKGRNIPYVSHLLAVTALILEEGGDEDQAIAALLHDAVEDQGGLKTLEIIQDKFGDRVAAIVEGCTDSFQVPKPPWKRRKEQYLKHLKTVPDDIRMVSLADKVHNASAILRDLQQSGEITFERFNGGKEGTLWYYRSLLSVFQETSKSPLVGQLETIIEKIEELLV